jgi:hypothetical protein
MNDGTISIERYYKLGESSMDRKEPEPYYWYKEIRMTLDRVCGLLDVDEAWFKEQAKIHGNQTAKKIVSGEIEMPSEEGDCVDDAEQLSVERIEGESTRAYLKRLSAEYGPHVSTLEYRWSKGKRGVDLLKKMRVRSPNAQDRSYTVEITVTATKGDECKVFRNVEECSIFLNTSQTLAYDAIKRKRKIGGWAINKIKKKIPTRKK